MDKWLQDFKYGMRRLMKAPGFTTVAILSLALGIGANTAIFTVINAVFLHPLAIHEPSRVVEFFTRDTLTVQTGNFTLTPSSIHNFEDYRDQSTSFSGVAAYFGTGLQWTHDGETTGLPGMMTTANYFDVLGVKPVVGRTFNADEDIKTAAPVAVLSHSLWTSRFNSDSGVVGRTLTLNGLPFTVIGVTQQGFKGTFSLAGPDRVWIPLGMRDQILTGQTKTLTASRRFRWLNIVGRLKPGVTLAQAQAATSTIASSLEKAYPDANRGRTMELAKETDAALGINQRPQFVRAGGVLMVVVGFVLLIACVNLANLLLAQAARREREITIRATLGASRGRLVRQLLIESVTLSMLGGVAGLVVAFWSRNALWAFRPPFLGNASIDLSFDLRVLGFTLLVSLLTGLAFGAVPALKVSQTRLSEIMKSAGRSGGSGAGHNRVRATLVAAEIALATVALIGSGLFLRSMQAAQDMDLGFDSKHIGFIALNPAGQKYETPQGRQFYQDAIARARAVPDVKGAAVASLVPLVGGGGVLLTTFPEGQGEGSSFKGALIAYNDITPGFFDALRIPLAGGRDFTDFDTETTTPVAIINETAARQLFSTTNAVSKRFTIVNQKDMLYEVVGVARDSTLNNVGEDPRPMIFRPMQQEYAPNAALVVRTGGEPGPLLATIRDLVQTLDKNMPMRNTGTVQEQIVQGLWASRMGAALLSIFGGLALALAMIGIYGVMSYSVSQRTQEIGIRMALGAQAGDVRRFVLWQGMVPAVIGAVVGVAAAAVLGRPIADLLYGIKPHDPLTVGFVSITLTMVALVACYIPSRIATRIDPLVALRYE
jgi:predicted permease